MVQNGLNIHSGYCGHWELDQAVREVVQNAIDGAVEWASNNFPGKEKSDLRPGGKGWYITCTPKTKPPKKFFDAGFTHGGRAEMILTIRQKTSKWDKPKKMRDWHKDQQSVAFIKIEVASQSEIDWADFKSKGQQPPGTVLVRFETINRVLPSFRMVHLQRIGRTLKVGKADQAGQFGEGFKVGAVVAARNKYSLVVEAIGQRRGFMIKKNQLCFEKQDSRLSKEANANPALIFVKLQLKRPPFPGSGPGNYHHFNPSFFRLLSPGVPHSKEGVLIKEEEGKGTIFCMGIFITKRSSLLLGYDIPQKDFISGRDRNGSSIHTEELRKCILFILERASEKDKKFIPCLLKNILKINDEPELRTIDEVNALFQSKDLCTKLADCFRNENGEDAFPCRASEAEHFQNTFKNRRAVILEPTVVDLLRMGGYRDIEGEISFLFSDHNKVDITHKDEALVKSCIFRLNIVDEGIQVVRESLVFVNGRYLNYRGTGLGCRAKGEIHFVNNAMLSLTEDDFLRTSNKLGYTIATKVGNLDNFGFRYSEKNDSINSWYTFKLVEVGSDEKRVRVCQKILDDTHEIRAIPTNARETISFFLTGTYTELPDGLLPGIEYSFQAFTEEGAKVVDPLTQKCCAFTEKMKEAPPKLPDPPLRGISETESMRSEEERGELDGSENDIAGVSVATPMDAAEDSMEYENDSNGGNGDTNGFDIFRPAAEDNSGEEDLEDDLTVDELMSVFGNDDDADFEYSDSESESEDEQEPKRPRKTLPCDEDSAMFGPFKNKQVFKGRVYRIEKPRRIVRVVEFTGKRLPVRKACCEILYFSLMDAMRENFHKTLEWNDLYDNQEDHMMVYEKVEKHAGFMGSLLGYDGDEDFDDLTERAIFQLTRSRDAKRKDFMVEFRRVKLDPSTIEQSGPCGSAHKRELVLFAGVGGSSIGDKKAGFDVKYLVEKDPLAAASLRDSHPDASIYPEDVRLFLDKCRDNKPGYPAKETVEHLQASPPCQGYSSANRGGRNDSDNKALSYEVVRAVEILHPRTVVMENVTGILHPKHLKHTIQLSLGLIKLGYHGRVAVYNAARFGDPQNRLRVIFTFSRGDTPLPQMPTPTHEESAPRTLGDALEGLPKHCDMDGSGLQQLSCGNYTFNHVASAPAQESDVLDEDEPVNTITTKNNAVHPDGNRTLSLRELARLFSYPDDKQFFGSMTAIRKQIGNSVPVGLAEAVARPIVAMYHEIFLASAEHEE